MINMFNMGNIELKIAKLRKDAGLTQMELAERMNISFQAVSSWERGQTMPDISKLHELSEIFGVSIDEILNNKRGAQIVEAIALDKLPEEIPTMEELAEVGPILSVNQVDKAAETVMHETGSDMDLTDILKLAPFLSDDFINEIAAEAFEKSEKLSEITPLLDYMCEDTINEIAKRTFEKTGKLDELSSILDYMCEDTIDEIAAKALEMHGTDAIAPIIDYVSEDVLKNYLRKKLKK